jgi:hypothetical protein
MKTLQEDIDDLDRMVDTDAPKHSIRSQIRLISREVSVLHHNYARLAESHQKLQAAHAKLQDQHSKLKAAKPKPPQKSGPGFVMGWKK